MHFNFVKDVVKNYLNTTKTINQFKNNTPGRDWFVHFLNRWKHKIIASFCTSEIENYFKIDEINPKNIWNVDLSSIRLWQK